MTALAELPLLPRDAGLCVVALPAPAVPATRALSLAAGDACYWAAGDTEIAGVGAAAVITAAGDARFASIRDQARALFEGLVCRSGAEPRLYGGLAFQPGGADAAPWSGFGDARFVLPRLCYTRAGGEAHLALAVHARELATDAARAAWADRLATALSALERPLAPSPPRAVELGGDDARAWRGAVEDIAGGIARGRFDKVVAARRVTAELARALPAEAVLDALARDFPACTRFAFRRGARTFLGATPERLVDKRGLAIRTEALAGSIRAGSADDATRLLASHKDQGEHAFVVRHVLERLAPLCATLEHAPEPEIRGLRNVLHLRTPISGTLRAPCHVLDVAERLHPTPAVAGTPTAAALDWIAANEPDARGWYAGPVGWFDGAGDGELAVALRSGVLDGARAHLYAGAGIVRGSDADAEYAETRLKLAALLSALEAP